MRNNGQICVELQEVMGSDRAIAESAWTSSTTLQGKEKRTDEDVIRIVKMLIDHKHHSPLEAVVFRFWIKMPIFTDRQHMTHRIASHNGMSGRYRTMPEEWYHVPSDVQEILLSCYEDLLMDDYENLCEQSHNVYRTALNNLKEQEKLGHITNAEYKRVREFYRGILPQSSMTERVTIMNLRSFANYQKLRNSEHAQPEIKTVAQLMLAEVEDKNMCPVAIHTLKEKHWEL
jgi:thymidylate synthase (FAD)